MSKQQDYRSIKRKAELVAFAEGVGAHVVPDEMNMDEIREAIERALAEQADPEVAEPEPAASVANETEEPVEVFPAEPESTYVGEVSDEEKQTVEEFKAAEPASNPDSSEDVVKSGGRTVRVRQFFGSYRDAIFVEDETKQFGVCKSVSEETLNSLRIDFPNADVEVTD
jgi:hypothetical protein